MSLQVIDQIRFHWREGATDVHGLSTGLILRVSIGVCAQLALYRSQKITTAMETVWIAETGSCVASWQGHRVGTSSLRTMAACVCRKSRYSERAGGRDGGDGRESSEIGFWACPATPLLLTHVWV